MIKASEFSTFSVQTVAFTPDHTAFAPGAVLASAMGKFAHIFKGEINVLPFPAEVPAEIARVSLKSEDGQRSLAASPSRLGIGWSIPSKDEAVPGDAVKQCAEILAHHFELNPEVKVNRLGFVIKRTARVTESATELIHRFCDASTFDQNTDASPLRNSQAFEIHNLKTYSLDEFRINSWMRCKSGRGQDAGEYSRVNIEQDLNTLQLVEDFFDSNKISKFFELVEIEASEILAKYFPG